MINSPVPIGTGEFCYSLHSGRPAMDVSRPARAAALAHATQFTSPRKVDIVAPGNVIVVPDTTDTIQFCLHSSLCLALRPEIHSRAIIMLAVFPFSYIPTKILFHSSVNFFATLSPSKKSLCFKLHSSHYSSNLNDIYLQLYINILSICLA